MGSSRPQISVPGGATAARGLVALVLAALALLAAGCGGSESEPAPLADEFDREAPNVVVVMTDDQALDTMKAMPRTTRLFARRGTDFTNSLVSFPLCCPSRAAFLTGQYAHNNNVRDNHPPAGSISALNQDSTLPVWLNRAGYRTGFVGKYLNGYGKDKNGGPLFIPPGWSDWYGMTSGDKTSAYDYDLNQNGELVHYGSEPEDYKTDVLAERASDYIRAASPGERPFFLWVATSAPHSDNGLPKKAPRNPLPAPRDRGSFDGERLPRGPAFDEADVSDKPRYVRDMDRIKPGVRSRMRRDYISELESLGAVDDLVARLADELREQGELGRTLFLFTSDNGFLRGQHRITAGKSKLYEESVRVPLLAMGPEIRRGAKAAAPVVNVDLARTIVGLAGAPTDIPLDGLPLTGAYKPEARRRSILLEVFERRQDRFLAVRTMRWVYAEHDGGEAELYDLRRDPHQLRNVVGERRYKPVRKRLARELDRLSDCAGDTCH